jgi:hypothetical protein
MVRDEALDIGSDTGTPVDDDHGTPFLTQRDSRVSG